jgi:hypothetical protein
LRNYSKEIKLKLPKGLHFAHTHYLDSKAIKHFRIN